MGWLSAQTARSFSSSGVRNPGQKDPVGVEVWEDPTGSKKTDAGSIGSKKAPAHPPKVVFLIPQKSYFGALNFDGGHTEGRSSSREGPRIGA